MALLFCDGFPYDIALASVRYNYFISNSYGGAATIETTDGRSGGRWMRVTQSTWGDGAHHGTTVRKTLGGTATTIIVQFGYKPIDYRLNTIPIIFFMDNANGTQVSLYDVVGVLKVYRGEKGGTLLATASKSIDANAWHQIEMKVTISNSAGVVIVKVDGETLINIQSGDGVDTQNTALTICDAIQFGNYLEDCNNVSGISDIIIMDTTGSYCNDFLGARIVQVLMPTSAGTYSQFTPSAGSNYQCVDETSPNGDTDYNAADTAGEKDTFNFGDAINPNGVIDAVVFSPYVKTDDGGSAKFKAFVRSNGDEAYGTERPIYGSYAWVPSIIYVDPDTGVPFVPAGFNAAEFGYERTL